MTIQDESPKTNPEKDNNGAALNEANKIVVNELNHNKIE